METPLFTQVLSYATVLAQVATVFLFALWIRDRRAGERDGFTARLHAHALWMAALVAAVGSVGSLVYSDVFGYAPCTLCWYQRAFLYPQAVMLAMAAWMRDRHVVRYALALCGFGALVALDQVWMQFGNTSLIPCAADGPSCDLRYVFEFGYVTIPVMSLTAFAFLAALLTHALELPRKGR